MVSRREFLLTGAAALTAPHLARADAQRVLRFVPRTDLGIVDPIWTTALITRNHAFMVFDTLFGQDSAFRPSPQMLAGYNVEDDERRWTLVLRDGLSWHDGERVLARDCVASIKRWGARDAYGQALMAATDELSAADDRTILFRLKAPFPFLPNALAKSQTNMPAMMPERLAGKGPGVQITEVVGSGPFRFKADERVPGARAVYERFARYKPREDGTPSRTAGPKHVYFDRVEWITMGDAATAANALQAGEIDWWDYPVVDLVPALKARPDLTVRVLDPNGQMNIFRMNQLHPPFDNPAIRRALLGAFDQAEFMTAVAGEDRSLWRDRVGVFCPDTPLATDVGLSVLDGPRDLEGAKRAIGEAGYKGEPIALLVSSDFPVHKALADIGADTMRRIGLNVDYQSLDWGTVQQRRYKKEPVDKGGWSGFFTAWDGADMIDPAGHISLRGNGANSWFGWPTNPKLEQLRDAWFSAEDLAAQKTIADAMQAEALSSVPYIPLGQNFQPTAYRSDLTGLLDGFAAFWNVRRAGA